MATVLTAGDIAIVQYNSGATDAFTFVFLRDVEVGTSINFTDNGWLAAGGFRTGEGTVTYTAPGAITAGTTVTLTGLNLDDAGDQIIAYQGTEATPTILHVIDLADGNNTVAGDATNDNTTALPPGFTLNVNAAAVGFDNAIYAGPNSGSPPEVFAAINDAVNWINSDATPTAFTFNFRPDLDLDRNNSTSFGDDYRADVTSGGPAVSIADTDVEIDDVDDFFISQAVIDIRGTDPGDLLAVNGTLPFGIFATSFNSFDGTLTLFGSASHAAYEAAIQQVVFSTTRPAGTVKTIDVHVFDGREWSNEASAIITVRSAAAPPVLDLDANNSNGGGADYTATAIGGGPGIPVADSDVSITDADSATIQSARITIEINRQLDDLLSIAGTLPAGITASSYNPSTGVITLSGAASLANYQTALRQVVYSTPDTTPFTGDRIITVTVNDGTFNSNTATTYMHVVGPPPNAPPVNTVPGAQSVAEDATLPIAGVSVADSDSSALTTTLNVASGTIHVTPGAGVTGNDSASVTIAGTAAQINAALAGLTYTGTLNFNGADTLTIATSDTIATDTDTIAITVNAVNDAPVNTVPGAQSVAEDTPLPIAGVAVADVDSSALTTTLNVSGGTINVFAGGGAGVAGNGTASVTITGTAAQINAALAGLTYTGNPNFNGADTLTVATRDGSAIDTDTIAITVNPVNDAPVNNVPGAQSVAEDATLQIAGVSVADVDNGALSTTLSVLDGTLTVNAGLGVIGNGTGSVTITSTTAQINAALAGLAYTGNLDFNGADTLTITTTDGSAIDTDTIAIAVNPVNDLPALDLDANNSTTAGANYLTEFSEGGPAVAIADNDVSIIDSDSPDLVSATITLTNPQALDTLTFNGAAPGSIVVAGSGTNTITLTGASSQADYQAALQQIEFSNGSLNPSTATRVIDVVVNDGAGNSNTAKAFVQVAVVNDGPVVDLDPDNSGGSVRSTFRTTFTENGAPVAIADIDVSVTDADSPTLASATITLANPHTGDVLTVVGSLPGAIISSGYNPGTGVLTLSGPATADEYELALRQISYSNSGDDPATEDRLIEVVVNDGANDSNVAAAVIGVAAVNDAPTLVVADATYQENATPVLLSPAASVADLDDTDLNFAAVQITAGSFPGDGDTLTVNGATSGTENGITFTWNPTLHALVLTGASSVANYQALLQTVAFESTSENPTDFGASPQRTLTWSVSDGATLTTMTTTLAITAENDDPINTVPSAQSVAEDTPLPVAGVSVADSDSSALTTTLNVASGTIHVIAGPGVSGNGTASVTITGTAAQINAALAGLSYTGNLDFNGADTLTVATSDGTAIDTDTIAISVTAVNDAPVNTVPGAQSVAEDTTPADRRRRGGGYRQQHAHHHAQRVERHAQRDRRRRRHRQRQRQRHHHRDGRGDQTALAGLDLYRKPRLQRRRHAHDGDQRRYRHRHRTIAITVDRGERRPGIARCGERQLRRERAAGAVVANAGHHRRRQQPAQLRRGGNQRRILCRRWRYPDGRGCHQRQRHGITFSWFPTLHSLVFNGGSSVANYQALLRTVVFQSTSDNPTDFGASPQRTLTWAVSDGTSVTTTTTTFDITAENDAPQETVAASAAYTENGTAVTISPIATASDVDDVNLVSGIVRIVAGWVDGDVLTVNGLQGGTFSGIDFSYDAGLALFCSASRHRWRTTRRSCRRSNSRRPARIRRTSASIRRARCRGACLTVRITAPLRNGHRSTSPPSTIRRWRRTTPSPPPKTTRSRPGTFWPTTARAPTATPTACCSS